MNLSFCFKECVLSQGLVVFYRIILLFEGKVAPPPHTHMEIGTKHNSSTPTIPNDNLWG